MAAPTPMLLNTDIEHACLRSAQVAEKILAGSRDRASGDPLCVKYVAPRFARQYRHVGRQLRISDSAGFTWGRGVYVTPLRYGVSSAIFGRVGVVGRIATGGWKYFDATNIQNQDLYLQWCTHQPVFQMLTLTMHSQLANQILRDSFRETFKIDAVLFNPDQSHPAYTQRTDIWMNISEWCGDRLQRRGFGARVQDTWAAAIIEDEFEDAFGGLGRRRLLGPLDPPQPGAVLAAAISTAWHARPHGQPVRILA